MINKKYILSFLAFFLLLGIAASAQTEGLYFPTGTEWEERYINYSDEYTYYRTFSIGENVEINGIIYKEVLRDGQAYNRWIREADGCVWLLTDKYPEEIKIYDFNFEVGQRNARQYIQAGKTHENVVTVQDIDSLLLADGQYYYCINTYDNATMVSTIGMLTERIKDCCVLGCYLLPVVPPSIEEHRLMWFVRNGTEIYRYEGDNTAIGHAPATNPLPATGKTYDLQGREVSGHKGTGIYVRDGKKVLMR